jgi:hypothetical protein
MDGDKDDKSIFEKTVEAVKDIATIASVAAHKAMEPEPIKPGDEVVMMPMAATGFMGDTMMPPFVGFDSPPETPEASSMDRLFLPRPYQYFGTPRFTSKSPNERRK